VGDGTLNDGTVPRDVTGLTSGVIAISAGDQHTCAITSAGGVKCWGDNGMGQLGNGTYTSSPTPVDVVGLSSGVVAISAGGSLTCALTSEGAVKCWGLVVGGGLGDGLSHGSSKPVNVAGLSSGVAAIAVGTSHACALTTEGAVKCWGSNYAGQLGDGTSVKRLTPVDVSGLSSGVVAVSAGAHHTCAMLSGGEVTCWGLTPVAVVGLPSDTTSIAEGDDYTCAVAGGAATCWGDNGSGQLGDGTTTSRSMPEPVVGLSSGVTAVDANLAHTCAVTSRGGVKCWGDNTNGDLGNGSRTGSLVPVDVYGFALG
jgi:alpha-tubulin suppressor-like RCC1 family protein